MGKMMINPENCRECRVCQLVCSLIHTGTFNPARAGIGITHSNHAAEIQFNDQCREKCKVCAQFCAFGALTASGNGGNAL